jgi:hypothetical protein
MLPQPLDHQLLRCPVSLRHQIEFPFQLEADMALEIAVQQRSGLARDFFADF